MLLCNLLFADQLSPIAAPPIHVHISPSSLRCVDEGEKLRATSLHPREDCKIIQPLHYGIVQDIMPKLKQKYKKPFREIQQSINILQTNKTEPQNVGDKKSIADGPTNEDLVRVSSLLDDESPQPGGPSPASTSELYKELHSFRQRWKRELDTKSTISETSNAISSESDRSPVRTTIRSPEENLRESKSCDNTNSDQAQASRPAEPVEERPMTTRENTDPLYEEAKKLFLIAVDLEKDDMHHESIRYYKKSMHLYPDIEKQIFREQCEASLKIPTATQELEKLKLSEHPSSDQQPGLSLYERILAGYQEESENQHYSHCRPHHKVKLDAIHISNLPHELLFKIFRHVVGQELDLASLEQAGMVCKGFYLMSRERSLWRDICFSTWGANTLSATHEKKSEIDWRQMFLERPRINFDGVYISKTRYFRQGDVGFQDITYRPFHVVRYYRYLRFFPDHRVLVLTTNEEPEKIVPIFRHALSAKQFSPDLSIMEGAYEFSCGSQICITAKKKCRKLPPSQSYRRQAQINWSQQTPVSQDFRLTFQLKTSESRPYRNNVLKWLEYTIETKLEVGQEKTTFDISPDTFPNLIFSRVKRFNLRSENPLNSHY